MHLKEILNYLNSVTKKDEKKEIKNLIPLIKRIFPLIETYLQSTDMRKKQVITQASNTTESLPSILQRYFEDPIFKTKQINLIEDLRFLILDALKKAPKEMHYQLEHYHSILHLTYFINKKGIKLHVKLREWLTTNFKSECIKLNLVRGNFDKVTLAYPELNEALEEFYLNDKKLYEESVDGNLDDVTMNKIDGCGSEINNAQRHEKWKKKYAKQFPKKFEKILNGTYDDKRLFWGDKLIYNLLYVKKDKYCKNEELRNMIIADNIYVDLLTGDYKEAFYKADKLMQIILLFVLPTDSLIELFPMIESLLIDLGRCISETDTLFSLHIFKFTSRLNYFYAYVANNIKMNNKIGKSMLQFSTENNLDSRLVLKRWIQCNIDDKNYSMIFAILREYPASHIDIDFSNKEAIEYCVRNYHEFCEILSERVMLASQITFIDVLYKIENNANLSEMEIEKFLEDKNSIHFLDSVFSKICHLSATNEFLLKMMNVVVEAEKYGIDVKPYRQILLENFYGK